MFLYLIHWTLKREGVHSSTKTRPPMSDDDETRRCVAAAVATSLASFKSTGIPTVMAGLECSVRVLFESFLTNATPALTAGITTALSTNAKAPPPPPPVSRKRPSTAPASGGAGTTTKRPRRAKVTVAVAASPTPAVPDTVALPGHVAAAAATAVTVLHTAAVDTVISSPTPAILPSPPSDMAATIPVAIV